MKIFKRLVVIFFIIITFTSVFFLTSGCNQYEDDSMIEAESNIKINNDNGNKINNDSQNTNNNQNETENKIDDNQEDNKEDQEQDNQEQGNQEQPNDPNDDLVQRIFIESITFPNDIKLLNNGEEIRFIINFQPFDTTESIYVEYTNDNIIIFNEDGECEETFTYLVDKTYWILPVCEGQTSLTIYGESSENEYITKTCPITVEEYENFKIQNFNSKGEEISEFKSGQKADKTYEIYTALISSQKPLENRGLDFILSQNIICVEDNSQSFFQEDEKYYYSFDFYLKNSENHSIQAVIQEDYLNNPGNIFTQKVEMLSTDYIKEFAVQVTQENKENALIQDNKYLLYFVEDESKKQLAALDGFYSTYLLNIDDENISFDQLDINIVDNEIINITENGELKVTAKGIGEASILFSAKDGSGQFFELTFKVVKILPTILEVNGVNILSNYQEQDLENAIGNISFYVPNNLEFSTSAEIYVLINNKYTSNSFIRFETELDIIMEEEIQEYLVLRKFTFTSQESGNYRVDLIVDEESVYSFNIEVLEILPHFRYEIEDNYNVYNFDERVIIVTSLSFWSYINFTCKVFDAWEEINQTLNVELIEDNNDCVKFIENKGLEAITIQVKNVGEFTFTITDTNLNISVEIHVTVNP